MQTCDFFLFKVEKCFGVNLWQNLLCVKEVNTPNCYGGIGYLGFEKLTFVPIQVC